MRPTGRIVTSPEICLDSSSKSDMRWFALLGAIAASVLLVTSLGYGLTLQGFALGRPTSVPQRGGTVQALDDVPISLLPANAGTLNPVAVLSLPESDGAANPGAGDQHSPHGKGHATGPIDATLPSGPAQYRAGIGWSGISGANSSCFQPIIGMSGSPLACLPPDVTMSASPHYVVEEDNTAGIIWTNTGHFVKRFTLTNFYTVPSGAGCYLSDPQVYFDNGTQRWFSSILSVTCGALNTQQPDVSSQIYLGVSQTSDPSAAWFEYVIPNPLPLNLSDQPFLGMNDHVVVISTNQFPFSALAINTYTGAYFWVLDKLALEQDGCTNPGGLFCSVDYQAFGPYSDLASIHPAHSYGPAPTEYMASLLPVNPGQTGVSTLNFFRVEGTPPSASVVMTNLTVRPTEGPPLGNQPGMDQSVNTDDSRISTGVYQGGVSWWGANDGCTVAGESGVHDCIRLIQIGAKQGKFQVRQDFDFNSGNNEDDYYPGITLDPSGDLAVTYAFSSPTEYPSVAISLQSASQPGALQTPTTVAVGTDTEQGGRYGDFCDASPSYGNPSELWFACEYIINYNDYVWNTRVQQMFVTG